MSSSYKMDNMPLNDTNVSSTSSSPNNPILLLGDYCFRNRMKTAPVYDFQQLAETISENAWECCVTVGQHVIKRCGQNKKMARHNAAKAMLDELNEHQGSRVQSPSVQSPSVQSSGGQLTIPVNNQQLTAAPTDAAACIESLSSRPILMNSPPPKTPLMLLNERCTQKGFQPKFDLREIGIASFECCVTVGEQVAKGCGRNKQEARQMAAKAILEKLNNHESSVQESSDQRSSDLRSNVQGSSDVESSVQESRAVNNQLSILASTKATPSVGILSSTASNVSKTPVSLLEELRVKERTALKYNLEQSNRRNNRG